MDTLTRATRTSVLQIEVFDPEDETLAPILQEIANTTGGLLGGLCGDGHHIGFTLIVPRVQSEVAARAARLVLAHHGVPGTVSLP